MQEIAQAGFDFGRRRRHGCGTRLGRGWGRHWRGDRVEDRGGLN